MTSRSAINPQLPDFSIPVRKGSVDATFDRHTISRSPVAPTLIEFPDINLSLPSSFNRLGHFSYPNANSCHHGFVKTTHHLQSRIRESNRKPRRCSQNDTGIFNLRTCFHLPGVDLNRVSSAAGAAKSTGNTRGSRVHAAQRCWSREAGEGAVYQLVRMIIGWRDSVVHGRLLFSGKDVWPRPGNYDKRVTCGGCDEGLGLRV